MTAWFAKKKHRGQKSGEYHLKDVREAKAQSHSPGPPKAQRKRLPIGRVHLGHSTVGDEGGGGGRDRGGSLAQFAVVLVGRRRSHVISG